MNGHGSEGLLSRAIHAFAAHPRGYDFLQYIAGYEKSARVIREYTAHTQAGRILDFGGGTGNMSQLVPPSASYLWLDIDVQKLAGFCAKYPGRPAILGDVTRVPLADKSMDYGLCIAVAHHLPDELIPRLFQEMARITRKGIIFCDPLAVPSSIVSNLMWRYDRGSFPRSYETLVTLLESSFVIQRIEQFKIYHRYLICTAEPRA